MTGSYVFTYDESDATPRTYTVQLSDGTFIGHVRALNGLPLGLANAHYEVRLAGGAADAWQRFYGWHNAVGTLKTAAVDSTAVSS